jgi:FlaA1/EpsC-like NDP-sugar epimerase
MRDRIKQQIKRWYLPHWMVIFADFIIMGTSFFITYFLRFNLFAHHVDVPAMVLQLLAGLPFFFLAIYTFKPYQGILRHSTLHDILTLAKTHMIVSFGFLFVSLVGHIYYLELYIPLSIITVHYFVSVSIMITLRVSVQFSYRYLIESSRNNKNTMIYGAGKLGRITNSVIAKDDKIKYKVVGYIDDNPSLWKGKINGVKIYSPAHAFEIAKDKLNVEEIILAISPTELTIKRKREIVDECLSHQLMVREVPDPRKWLNGNFAGKQIKTLSIEDLLGRDPISINKEIITSGIHRKRVMVTGSAGSIGSEIVKQLLYHSPKSIILIDQAESAQFDLQQEILPALKGTALEMYIADVTDYHKMRKIFELCRPEIIYHAAAYKHVPLMEDQPYMAVWNNIGGTRNLADLAVEFEVEKFVMVSTDKAVNPTNIMGTTKRVCELYIQSLSQETGIKTQFITTRFGNVLGSNGSVIPLFKKQIASGGPVTLTHKDIIRYFMTIPEACQLVMEAGFIGKGGEIFLFDMGDPVKIYDLAVKMISLSGFIPHKEVEIKEIGLRPGEKLYEELLADKEETLQTEHEKILIAKIRPYPYEQTIKNIRKLLEHLTDLTDMEIVFHLKRIVPEFHSQNSKYSVLDELNTK